MFAKVGFRGVECPEEANVRSNPRADPSADVNAYHLLDLLLLLLLPVIKATARRCTATEPVLLPTSDV